MKRIISIAILFAAAFSVSAQTTIDASDSKVVYVGRTLADGASVSFDWSGVTARLKFNGTSASIDCSVAGEAYFNVWVDKAQCAKADFSFRIAGDSTVVLAGKLKKGEHTIILQKRNEGEQGVVTFKSFTTNGSFLQGEGLKDRKIEFIGDSYTCGYGTEAADRSEPFRPAEENCNLTYAAISSRYFDADFRLVSHSGRGIVRNYDDAAFGDTMVKKYGQTFDEREEPSWDASSSFIPDIVVIYLGTNDFSTGKQPRIGAWCEYYARLLKQIRANYGENVPILCVGSMVDERMGYYVEEAVRRSGVANAAWTAIHESAHNQTTDLGASWHPNYAGQRKVASCMIPYISTLTGWDMPFKAVE